MRGLLLRQLRRRLEVPPVGTAYRVAVIRWDDTHPVPGWLDVDTLDGDPCVITSAAFVLPLTTKADHLSICQDVAPTGEVNGVCHLPLACVRSVHFLT